MHWIFSCGVRHHVVGILINFVRLKRHPNPRLIFQLFPLFTVDVDWMLIRDLRTSALALASPVRDQISWVGIQVVINLFVTAQTVVWAFRNFTPSPSPFICKPNVGLATSTYSGTMFRIIGWRRVSKSSEKSSRSHTVFGTIGGSAFTSLNSFILIANCRYIFHLLI